MTWNEEKEVLLAREILVTEPYRFKEKSKERGQSWQRVCENLNKLEGFTTTSRSVRDRFKLLEGRYKKKMNDERRQSGIDVPEMSEIDSLLEEIVLRKTEAENVNKDKVTKEKELGEDVRQRALETFKETKERNEGEPKPKKTRNTGCDTVEFSREKMEVDNLLKASELQLRQNELNSAREERMQNQEQTNNMMLLMQNSMQQMQQAFMQSQQVQNQAFLTALEKLVKK